MKKILNLFIITFCALFLMVGCIEFNDNTELKFVKYPEPQYTVDEGKLPLNDIIISVDGEKYSIEEAMNELNSNEFSVSGYTWSQDGQYTLVIKYNTATISFGYFVGKASVEEYYNTNWEGKGTESEPYQISNVEELKGLAAVVNGKVTKEGLDSHCEDAYFKLTNDINLQGEIWTPIGEGYRKPAAGTEKNMNYFAGYFDGDGHTISNLSDAGYFPSQAGDYDNNDPELQNSVQGGYVYGLFGLIYDGATIVNLNMTNVSISGHSYYINSDNKVVEYTPDGVGAVVGAALIKDDNNTTDSVTLKNITVSGSISGYDSVAGIIGRCGSDVELIDLTNNANITSERKASSICAFVGGANGFDRSFTVKMNNLINNGTVASKRENALTFIYLSSSVKKDDSTTNVYSYVIKGNFISTQEELEKLSKSKDIIASGVFEFDK